MGGLANEATRDLMGIGADTWLEGAGKDWISEARTEAKWRVKPMRS